MVQVIASLKTIDLRGAQSRTVADKDVKTLQALLNLFLTAGDGGEDGSPIPPLALDGGSRGEDKTGGAGLPEGGAFGYGRHRRPADLEEAHRAGLLN